MASQVQIPFEGVILQEHSAPISCPTPNFAKGSREKEISTKGHEGPRRATKGLEKAREGPAKDRQGEKGFPRKGKRISTKGHEERRRATKGLEEAQEGSAKGREGGPQRDSKGLEKTRKGSVKGHEERHKGKRISTEDHEGHWGYTQRGPRYRKIKNFRVDSCPFVVRLH